MNYDLNYFIGKFENIPEHLWTTGTLEGTGNRHCCLGHCGMTMTTKATEEADALAELVDKHLKLTILRKKGDCDFAFYTIFPINDNQNSDYKQRTPKQRILAALYDIKKIQTPEPHPEIPPTKTKEERTRVNYVSISASLKKAIPELIQN